MRKLFIILLLFSNTLFAQTGKKIMELPEHTGSTDSAYTAISISGITKRARADFFGVWDFYVRNDSLFKKRFAQEIFVVKTNQATNITGLVNAGSNITISGSGTLADPYVINSLGGGGTGDYITNQYLSKQVANFWIDTGRAVKFKSDTVEANYIKTNELTAFNSSVINISAGSIVGLSASQVSINGAGLLYNWINQIGRPNNNLYIGHGGVAYRNNNSDPAQQNGKSITLEAQWAAPFTNKNGGNFIISTGASTGTGDDSVIIKTATPGASGVTDNLPTAKFYIRGNGTANYTGNFGSSFTDRSLPDKKYVDSAIAANAGGGGGGGYPKAVQPLTSSASISFDIATGNHRSLLLAHNASLSITNIQNGDEGWILVQQDGTGNRLLTFPAGTKIANGYGSGTQPELSTAPLVTDLINFIYNGSAIFITSVIKDFQ